MSLKMLLYVAVKLLVVKPLLHSHIMDTPLVSDPCTTALPIPAT